MARRLACFGRRYPSYRYEVPDEQGVQGGLVAAPPAIAASLTHPLGAQQFEHHRPLRAGDVLLCTPSIVNVAANGQAEIVTTQLECTDAATGAPVLTARATFVLFAQDP